jgi:hypothetical protein
MTKSQTFLFGDDTDAAIATTKTERADDKLLDDLKNLVKQQYDATPRHLQRELGPSEVGHPCARKIATALIFGSSLDEAINQEGDPLPSWLGTAGHSRFEQAVALDNELHPNIPGVSDGGRWYSERRVTTRGSLAGTCDLYDRKTGTVIDLKFPGATKMGEYRRHGPMPEYKVQAHMYGRGYRNEGYPVQRVAIWFIPRGGLLSQSFLWTEPYDDAIVEATLARLDNILILLDEFDVEHHPQRLAVFPKTIHNCGYCPYFTMNPNHPNPIACTGAAK